MPKRRRLPCGFFLVFFTATLVVGCFLLPSSAVAQTELAGLYGRVTDQSGAVIVDAEVEIKNVETNQSIIVKTNQDGLYTIPSLHPGHYLISARKPGFKTVTVTELELNIQDNVVRNFALQVGSIAETVTITADQNNINTTDASVSTVVDQTYIKNMPLNGRSFQDLILLTPGIVTQSPEPSGPYGSTVGSGLGKSGEFSVNGQRTESNNYTVDGVSANVGAGSGFNMVSGAGPSGSLAASTALGTTQALVSVDDLQEFRVQSSTYSAQYGRNPGGQFAFETKSGTNQWHGTAYDYLRNDIFDATDYFTNYFRSLIPTLRKAPIRQNDFGGTLGGPVRIPRLYDRKDKSFFFVSYEGLRLISPQPTSPSIVPDATLRSTAPAPLNQVLNAFPVPNGPEVLVPCDPATDPACPSSGLKQDGLARYIASWSNPSSIDSTSVRFDHFVNDKLRLFFRFSDTASSSTTRVTSAPALNTAAAYTLRTYTAGASSNFSSHFSNDFRLNYSSNEVTSRFVISTFGGSKPVDLAQLLGLGPGSRSNVLLLYDGNAVILIQDRQFGTQRQWNLVDTLSMDLGRHQFKIGVDYRRLAPFAVPRNPDVSYYYFSESAVETNSAGARAFSYAPAYPLYMNFSAFAQDEWRVSQRLSVSLGLRWEVNPAPGVTQGLKPYTLLGSSPDNLTLAPQGTPLWHTTWYNFAPRLGVAYVLHNAPGRETVVRSGGGVFFDTGQQNGSKGFSQSPGFSAGGNFSSLSFPVLPPVPVIVNPPVLPYRGTLVAFNPHLQLPYTLQWNASVEQALGRSQALSVSYVGSHASRLLQQNQFFPPNNPITGFNFVENGLTSDYDALQVQFRRRLSKGLTVLAAHTWSHCMDYGSENFNFGYQRGDCDFDIRQNLSAAFSYDLPNVGHNGFVNAALHHWGLDGRLTARTAFPVTLLGNFLVQPDGQTYNEGQNFVAGQPVYLYGANCASVLQGLGDLQPGQGCPGGRAINPNAFTSVSTGLGDAPRNFARGFRASQMNLAIRRDFPIHENLRLQFHAEAFNIFNHPNLGRIDGQSGSSTFGQATATLATSLGILNPFYQMGGPRSMQFALKLVF